MTRGSMQAVNTTNALAGIRQPWRNISINNLNPSRQIRGIAVIGWIRKTTPQIIAASVIRP